MRSESTHFVCAALGCRALCDRGKFQPGTTAIICGRCWGKAPLHWRRRNRQAQKLSLVAFRTYDESLGFRFRDRADYAWRRALEAINDRRTGLR